MNKLAASKEFDAVAAEKHFKNREEFFECLYEFATKNEVYLHLYNPTMVIHSEQIKQQFINELDLIEQQSGLLELSSIMVEVNAMRYAIIIGSVDEISDGIVKFQAKMEIVSADIISAALTQEQTAKPTKPVQKPLLIAIDNRTSVLASVTGVLEKQYKVISVTNSAMAIGILKNHTPDLFLIGVEMRGMSGYELAEQIRQDEKFNNTPIMFMTDVIAAAGKNHILVPIDRKLLPKQIEVALKGL